MAADEEKHERHSSASGVASEDEGKISSPQTPTESSVKDGNERKTDAQTVDDTKSKLERVPRRERRGLLARVVLIPEAKNPQTYSKGIKWIMTIIVALCGATSSTGSSVFYPALAEVAVELNTTTTITNLSMAFYMLAMAVTPLWWSAWSETLGRRTIYLVSFTLYVIFSVASALSVNITMLIIFRILSGGAAASVQAVGAGTVADLWEPKERGRAMGIFQLGPLAGPGLAPIFGGALAQAFGWRSTLWFLAIFGGSLLLLILFCLPETLAARKPVDPEGGKKPSALRVIKRRFIDPFQALGYLRYPPITIVVYVAAMSFGSLFAVNMAIQANFGTAPYNFSELDVGLLYIAPTIGYASSALLGGRWIDYIMAREARRAERYQEDGTLKYLPEDRMRENAWLAASLYPAAMIWYGWSVDKHLHWAVGAVASFVFGVGMMLVFGAVITMLTEFTPKKTSSGVALNNFVRNLFSCTAAVITQPLLDAMGPGWMFTMIGLFAWLTTNAAILALRKWGPRWRVSMDKKLNPSEQ